MISSSRDYKNAMKRMIRKVQGGYKPPFDADAEELEILSDCIKSGYIRGQTTYIGIDGHEHELRTLDGKMHPEITNHIIPPKGLAFLYDSSDDESDKPNEADCTKRRDKSGNKFFQTGTFWTAVAVIVTIALWLIDRFYFGVQP